MGSSLASSKGIDSGEAPAKIAEKSSPSSPIIARRASTGDVSPS